MPLPLLSIPPVTNNARVRSFSLGSDETPRRSAAKGPVSAATLDEQIEQAYRQIYFHAFKVDREPVLESRLRSGQISMREFVRGLLYSNKFRDDFYRCNSNYRMVDQIVGRVLGRPVHGQQERIALSILLAQQGVGGLADHLLDSQEYRDAFGDDTIPHQRSRVLPGVASVICPSTSRLPATTPIGGTPRPAVPPPVVERPGPRAAAAASICLGRHGWPRPPHPWPARSGRVWSRQVVSA